MSDMIFTTEKLGSKKWAVIDTQKRANAKDRVVATFTTKARADEEAAASNADYEAMCAAEDQAIAGAEKAMGKGKAPKAAPAPVVEVTPVSLNPAEMNTQDRLAAAKAEAAAKKAAKAAGEPAPATPVLDWMASNPTGSRKAAKTVRAAKGTGQGPAKPFGDDVIVPGARFQHGDFSAVVEDDGTWTVSEGRKVITKGNKTPSAAMNSIPGINRRDARVWWKLVTGTPVPA